MTARPSLGRIPSKKELKTWANGHSAVLTDTRNQLLQKVSDGLMDEDTFSLIHEAIAHATALGWLQCDLTEGRYSSSRRGRQ